MSRSKRKLTGSRTPWATSCLTVATFDSASKFARTPGWRIGRADNWPDKPVDLLLNPSASHFAFQKHQVRRRFVLDGSRAFHVVYIYANLLGNEAGRAIYDGDAMIASGGQLLASGPRFSFRDFHVTSAVVDIELGARRPRPVGQLSASGRRPANRWSTSSLIFRRLRRNPRSSKPRRGTHLRL